MTKNRVFSVVLACGLAVAGLAIAQKTPPRTGTPSRVNLNSAQKLTAQAYDKLIAAQKANEWDQEGHAARAKDLLEQAKSELALAAAAK